MHAPAATESARDALRTRVRTLTPHATTLGALLNLARELFDQMADEREASVELETYALTRSSVSVELVWRWPHAEPLDARPERLILRFDVTPGPRTREVRVRSRDYPHLAAFVTAALEAAELDESAPASNVRVELEHP